MKTKTELKLMSDVQLISNLCELRGYTVDPFVFQDIITIYKGKKTTTFEMTYNDIMPIAVELKVGINWTQEDVWSSYHPYTDLYCEDKNPLCAIVMCLILVLQDKAE